MAKVKCPECWEKFEENLKDYDDGDTLDCPECGAELIVEYNGLGKPRIKTPKQKFWEEDEEFEGEEGAE